MGKDDFMTQSELEEAVARATGDSLDTVRRHGFQLEEVALEDFDDDFDLDEQEWDDGPLVFDWDDYAAVPLERYLAAAA